MLEFRSISKEYRRSGALPVPVLDNVSLRLDDGGTVAIVGPSGSGKTTLLNLAGGLDRPTSGAILFEGVDLAALDERRLAAYRSRSVGFVFQAHHLLPQCTVIENVLVPTLVGVADREAPARARRLLDRVGLGGRFTHRPGELSGGECQRVAVVRSLINRPRLLLADEPTGSLDRRGADALAELLAELQAEEQLALMVVTHSETLAQRMQRTLELRDGALVLHSRG
ncbi:MAG: Lipoprotein-releasing system ATP-binding protein LolD [Lentisphaerae bacterium ADurb.BinA184]|nr:MAG: Lipoprotein-releasing system ATP-binding protein LolD [Lentisphaerae bacterium ADurb.BinA184]